MSVPAGSDEVVKYADPPESERDPSVVEPSLKVRVPVAAIVPDVVLSTYAEMLTGWPAVTVPDW